MTTTDTEEIIDPTNVGQLIEKVVREESKEEVIGYTPDAGNIMDVLGIVDADRDGQIWECEPYMLPVFTDIIQAAFRFGFARGQMAAADGMNIFKNEESAQ